jgi:hypothetical protein
MPDLENSEPEAGGQHDSPVVARAFGAENRALLIDAWFAEHGAPAPDDAWQHVYRLLLWTDATTGLAHCYESDKSQPGRPWYARALAFHIWLSERFGVVPSELGHYVDRLFQRAVADLAAFESGISAARAAAAGRQRERWAHHHLPTPGEDAEMTQIIREELGPYFAAEPSADAWRHTATRIRTYLKQENKRKNMVGEGFEDVLVALINRLPSSGSLNARARAVLHRDVPGFYPPRANEKVEEVDVVILGAATGRRTLVTAKWSVRADREKQMDLDFDAYNRMEGLGQKFDYVFVTNEFDPARLARACERRRGNALVFDRVVHVAPDAVLAAYDAGDGGTGGESDHLRLNQRKVVRYIEEGRLLSLTAWFRELMGP